MNKLTLSITLLSIAFLASQSIASEQKDPNLSENQPSQRSPRLCLMDKQEGQESKPVPRKYPLTDSSPGRQHKKPEVTHTLPAAPVSPQQKTNGSKSGVQIRHRWHPYTGHFETTY